MDNKKPKDINSRIVKDVVCGMEKPIDEMKVKTVYKGKVYYFCTERDKQMFEAYPEHWSKRGGDKK